MKKNKWRQGMAAVLVLSVLLGTSAQEPASGTQTSPKKERISFGENNQRSSHYNLADGEVTLTIVSLTGNNSFRTSLVDETSGPNPRYITTTSFGEAWYTEASGNDPAPICTAGSVSDDVLPGHIYEAHYERSDQDYTITYTDYTEGELLYSYTAKGTNLTSANIYAYVNALAGSFEVYGCSPQDAGFSQGDLGDMMAPTHGAHRDAYVGRGELSTEVPGDYRIDPGHQKSPKDKSYDQFFLKDEIQTVEVTIDEKNFDYMLQNSASKEVVMAEKVKIGGEEIRYVGFKTKGNFTRSHTDATDSDRFSFSINFGRYVNKLGGFTERQNFYGLDKVSFNNFYFDKTMMKEYNALRLMEEMGVPTPQYGLARIYINGNYYGVYSMVENYDSSILKRYYHLEGGDLSDYMVKPSYIHPRYTWELDNYKDSSGRFTLDSLLEGGGLVENEDGTYSASGALLSYAGMWENDPVKLQQVARELPNLLTWLERLTNLSEGKDFEGKQLDVNSDRYLELLGEIIDIDEYLRYFAVHSFVCQMDNMFTWRQNYGLYLSRKGQSLLIPWDYDLAWGCDGYPADPESVANLDVDRLYNDVAAGSYYYTDNLEDYYKGSESDDYWSNTGYPLFYVIYQNNSLMERYHTYMEDCSKITFLGGTTSTGESYPAGRYAETINRMYDKVVEAASEPLTENAWYLNYSQPDSVKDGLVSLKQVIALRAVGVYLQTAGIDAYVTGFGAMTGKLGNDADSAAFTMSGERLAAVDADTGIFAVADYGNGSSGPQITVDVAEASDESFQAIQRELSAKDNTLRVYKIAAGKTPESDYQLYLPTAGLFGDAEVKVFAYSTDGGLAELSTERSGDLSVVKTQDLSCIAVYAPDGELLEETPAASVRVSRENSQRVWVLFLIGAAALAAGITIGWRRYRKKLKL